MSQIELDQMAQKLSQKMELEVVDRVTECAFGPGTIAAGTPVAAFGRQQMDALLAYAEQWAKPIREAREFKARVFPVKSAVYVQSARYRGFGFIARHEQQTPFEQLAVTLENGNEWWYPVLECVPVAWKMVNRATRRACLRHFGIKLR